MVAKLRAGLEALDGGVTDVRIVDGRAGAYATAAGTTIMRTAPRPSDLDFPRV